jgi:hypothetical protein
MRSARPPLRDGLCDPDETPAPPDEATTQPGDLWLLGEHRLLCGDTDDGQHGSRWSSRDRWFTGA